MNTQFALRHKAKLLFIRVMSGNEAPDVMKMMMYRHDFFGRHFRALFHEAMRGPSEWDVFEREVMAAFVSSLNQCVF